MKKEKKYYLYTMNMTVLNIVSVLLLVVAVLITLLIMRIFDISFVTTGRRMAIFYILMIPYFMFHEILHSIGYVVNGADFKKVTYGAHLEKGVLCCLVKQNITKRNILWSLMYPFLFIGIITYIIGLVINNASLVLLSIMNISGAAGDIIMFLAFIKVKNFMYTEYNDPTSFALYGDSHLENLKMFGLKYLGVADDVDREVGKKVEVSKVSIVFLIIFLLVGLINLI